MKCLVNGSVNLKSGDIFVAGKLNVDRSVEIEPHINVREDDMQGRDGAGK